ncbi:MAG: hypothetical protein U0J70_04220 [Atopobiaceae bacterium]|jgi:hypothetical protein|nr:hypothetical protein [Atopobiaceae bacterium]
MNPTVQSEFEAIDSIRTIMMPLSDGARRRVLSWLDDYFLCEEESAPASFAVEESMDEAEAYDDFDDFDDEPEEEPEDTTDPFEDGFSSFAQFYDFINPKTVRQKVATAGWWLEEEQGSESWKTFDISKSLKSIDKPVRYLSTTITQEKKKADPLVEQLSKSGDSMQAHGTYRLTDDGRSYIQGKLDAIK